MPHSFVLFCMSCVGKQCNCMNSISAAQLFDYAVLLCREVFAVRLLLSHVRHAKLVGVSPKVALLHNNDVGAWTLHLEGCGNALPHLQCRQQAACPGSVVSLVLLPTGLIGWLHNQSSPLLLTGIGPSKAMADQTLSFLRVDLCILSCILWSKRILVCSPFLE